MSRVRRTRPSNPLVWLPVVGAVLVRPGLWITALRQVGRLARRDWWRRAPFLPLPGRSYLEFRMETQYGGGTRRPVPSDVIHYLSWCQQMQRLGAGPR
jgi:hypothetical protein